MSVEASRVESAGRAEVGVGRVEEMYVAPAAAAPVAARTEVEAIAGQGLAGDRYANHAGTFTNDPRYPQTGRHVTLISAEALDRVARETDVDLAPGAHRRNLVVRGLDVDSLLGKRFRIGAVECVGIRPCPPCPHLERLTRTGIIRALVHDGGVRAEFLSSGTIRVGDEIVITGEA